MNLQSLKEHLLKLDQLSESICQEAGYPQINNPPQIEWNPDDPDETMMYDEFRIILCHLLYIHRTLDYLQKPVIHSGRLHKDRSGRYTLDRISLKHGMPVEVYSFDHESQQHKWKLRYLESSSHLQGLAARFRLIK